MSNVKCQMSNVKLLSIGYLTTVIFLFLYSFTQVDLGLTLTKWSIWQVAQKFFQSIGYFNRPFSAFLYILIISLLFIFYLSFLFLANKNRIGKRQVWIMILFTGVLLAFSYNAFSYDLFNYIFDAKIVTHYHQNPYLQKALDYPGDPMLSFMHWTHRLYPYGPVWLFLTVPLSFLGFQFFLPTFFLFKILMSASFVGSVFYIGKIVRKISPENEVFSLIFFGLNPLVIIESLVSAHNDIVMSSLLLMSIYLLINNKYIRSIFILILSIGIKYATIILIPFYLVSIFFSKKKKIEWQVFILLLIFPMILSIALASLRTNFQPWYLLYVLPLAALISKKFYIFVPAVVISFFSLLQYAPFLYLGNWDKPVPSILFWMTVIPIILSLIFIIVWPLKKVIK